MDRKKLTKRLRRWLHLKNKDSLGAHIEPPLSAELFHADQMERHSITLALSHHLTEKQASDVLLNRLSESEAILIQSCEILADKTTDSFSPGREWLLDNFYLIQEQILAIRRHLPKEYGRKLPQIVGEIPGYPRVYDIAREIIEHGDGRWDLENLSRFVSAYQGVTKLMLAELWAIPISLGVALIENLSAASQRIVADRNDRNLANSWANRMVEIAVSEPKQLVIVVADMARSEPPMSGAFVTELTRRLQGAALALPLTWIEQHLQEIGLTLEQIVQEENKQQAATQITVSNCIASLRRLGEVDWRIFVESMSIVEQTLRQDPTATYAKMDFGTRDSYRHIVEQLSSESEYSEQDVASCAIQLAKTRAQNDPEIVRSSHVGFYLIGKGLPKLKEMLGIRPSFWQKIRQYANQHALFCYEASIILITIGLMCLLLEKASHSGVSLIWLIVLGITLSICGSQLAIALVNLWGTLLIKPVSLPRMDFSKGIPASFRTLVVVPAMLGSQAGIETLVEALEVRFLGNRDQNLHFMLLTDLNDASEEHKPEDKDLLALAAERIAALNSQYPRECDTFFLCHRPRQWNPSEKVWMGRERKRGKLADLNNLLRGNIKTPFSLIVGHTDVLSEVKYVITLDSDTQLPREAARQFIGTMVHPLNRPHLDSLRKIVTDGYGILQPRVAEALPSGGPTRYVRLCGNEFGIDPYTRTVSDVYQDIFEEGSFIGKGIYDVDLFQQVLENRFPDNRILSHDLLEGCYLRSGFLSDVPLYEKSPSSYLADSKRRTRWIRGDWQLLPWLFSKEPLSLLSRFKIFDNLRRSLVPVSLLLLFGLSWTILPANAFWISIIISIVVLPSVVKTLLELLRKPKDMLPRQHFANIIQGGYRGIGQLILYLACLPHEAWYSLIAILRTCWRLMVSKRYLLEWVPNDQVDQGLHDTPFKWITRLWMGPVAALIAIAVLLKQEQFESLLFATPLLALWLASPFITRWLSKPSHRPETKLTSEQFRFLHRMARKTWGFFDTFMTAEDHWLPPDNYQEEPIAVLARRTSPTNIGLALLANLTAYDFGYISMDQFLNRTSNTLQTMAKLERYRGHLYNWYSTETLEPLLPRYVSTVDSGNLAGHLLTLRQGLLAMPDDPLLNLSYLDGLNDTWEVLQTEFIKPLPPELTHFQELLHKARTSFTSWRAASDSCQALCAAAENIQAISAEMNSRLNETAEWSDKLLQQCYALRDEINLFSAIPQLPSHSTLRDAAELTSNNIAKVRMALIEDLALKAFSFAQIDFSFLYNEASHLMSIGFNVDEQRRDLSSYDLLSSEARLGSFVAIAQGQVLQESWFALGRLLVSSGGEPILISWSGSMFEYLMPLLVMPTYPGTLLDQTYHAAVSRQIAYGQQCGVPWGVSESGFNAVDTQYNYLYRAFGVPGLGLKRGLEEDLVTAPYASVMALMVDPEAACLNLQRLAAEAVVGKFGFYEAIDFTATRLSRDSKRVLVRSFMSHHQGMSFLAFSYLLHHQPMQRRFSADPQFQATLLLLQERIPKPTSAYLQIPKSPLVTAGYESPEALVRVFHTPNTRTPQVQLLSNGHYHVVLTQAGGGYSRWKDIALTRWREDSTCDHWGLFSYVRDVRTGEFFSSIYQPTAGPTEHFKAVFTESHAEFSRKTELLDMHTEVAVSPEDDIELRRLRIHNRSDAHRTIEFTSYGEIVLAPQAADLAQPAFSNLFIETELLPENHAILATRRPRDAQESSPWLCHLLNAYSENEQAVTLSYETDRARFVGRGQSLASPLAMMKPGHLSNSEGAVLDPIISIRCMITIEPFSFVTLDLLTGVADTRANCIALIEKYQDRRLATRIFGLAWTHSQVLLHHLNITEAYAQLYGRLAGGIIYGRSTRRADPLILASNRRGQSGLWGYSISGDLPILLLHIEDVANIELVQQLIQAQAYWRRKGLMVDLVILNEERMSYRQSLQDQIMSLITGSVQPEQAGHIVLRNAEQVSAEDRILLQSAARVILSDKRGTLREQLNHRRLQPKPPALLKVSPFLRNYKAQKLAPLPEDLQFFNGLGGFSAAGDEYIIRLSPHSPTPAPWANVLANPNFGTLVSESGQAYTWTENAHEFRLTPWSNDPIQDSSEEAFYLRDEESGKVWSPTALPCRGSGDYQTRHGFGYSVFEHVEEGIHSELWMYVASDAPIKFFVLKIRNDSSLRRRLSATGYVGWVLGDLRSKNALHIVTELSQNGAILAQNHYNTEFGERTAFFDAATNHLDLLTRTATADRTEFLGRNGSLRHPAALKRERLSGRVGAGLDPCAAIHLSFNLAQGQSREIVFTLGAGKDKSDALILAARYHGVSMANSVLSTVGEYWKRTLNVVRVKTPDPALNLLANGWLLYQLLSSRLWARSGYYQSGGAFGFRDQLQDVMALTNIAPSLFREQILLCAAHQFEAGDVQHWWHPPHNRGVRTRCSDDYLWLPFAISHYVETTGDMAILDEAIPFLLGRPLNEDEESYYDLPVVGQEKVSLYQHAARAIKHGLKFGVHGLPLMGSGDWNDGMNLVGIDGRGESVWLGFFLFKVLKRFSALALRYGDPAFSTLCEEESKKLKQNIDANAWDGEWYRRAYFDDGNPLGSARNTECRIDSLSQSWSVLSGAGDPVRTRKAMTSLNQYLVSESNGLIKLLDPPFDKSLPNPGYIKGYLPGIRENGGQYTHAAIWAAMAFAELGEGKTAWQLFNILNPINHGRNPEEVDRYKIEPYVLAGDVYSVVPHVGRGGWSWYTGSAGWLYRLITETFLGLRLEDGNRLYVSPTLPETWEGFTVDYHYGNSVYKISVSRTSLKSDSTCIPLVDDGQVHHVIISNIHREEDA